MTPTFSLSTLLILTLSLSLSVGCSLVFPFAAQFLPATNPASASATATGRAAAAVTAVLAGASLSALRGSGGFSSVAMAGFARLCGPSFGQYFQKIHLFFKYFLDSRPNPGYHGPLECPFVRAFVLSFRRVFCAGWNRSTFSVR